VADLTKVLVVFIVVGLPVILIFGQPLIRRMMEHRERRMEMDARMAAEKAAQYAAQNERLEQRIIVMDVVEGAEGHGHPLERPVAPG